MIGRIALILLSALAMEFAGNSLLYAWQERQLVSVEQTRRIAEQLAIADRVARDTPPARRARFMTDLAIQGLALNWVARTVITDSSTSHTRLGDMKAQIEALSPSLASRDLRLSLIPSEEAGRRDLIGALRLDDGSFITFRVRPFLNSPPGFATLVALHLLVIMVVLGAALLMVRALVKPLSDLAEAADATGLGTRTEIRVEGPLEVRRVANAFSAMQTRLLRMIEEHTRALVAVSHDLRTPIQRLRLRAALSSDEEMREAFAADLAEMETFVGSVVRFMQGEEAEEERLVDVAAMAMAIVDDAADSGATIDYQGPDSLVVRLKPLTLKRILNNLVENATRHADRVCLSITVEADHMTLSVEDDGPGIPEDRREEAFLPFRRLDGASRQGNAGAGLGLAIVRTAVRKLGGAIELDESKLGGLAVHIRLTLGEAAA